MEPNPYRAPNEEGAKSPCLRRISGWWIATGYLMPILVMIPFLSEAGWYGVGLSGALQRTMQVTAFVVGMACTYYGIFCGTTNQRIAAAPAALGYTGLVIGVLVDLYS